MTRKVDQSRLYSLTGANAGSDNNWAWCIPNRQQSPRCPIIVLVITSDGPRYVPTSVPAPLAMRPEIGVPYLENSPTAADKDLADAVYRWTLLGTEDPNAHIRAAMVANDAVAAARFLSAEPIDWRRPPNRIKECDIYFGRSVLLYPAGATRQLRAWIVSVEEPFEVVVRSSAGWQKSTATADCLGEDGTAQRVPAE